MRKILTVLLVLSILFGAVSCTANQDISSGAGESENTESAKVDEEITDEKTETEDNKSNAEGDESESEANGSDKEDNELESKNMLDGKKIIFIGDSFVYYGQVVLNGSASRYNDKGYFYQLCKSMGAEVSVTNWTYSATKISTIYENYIGNLKDRNYDYVVISGGRNSANTAKEYFTVLQNYIEFFRAANPNVKFLYLVSSGAHNISVEETFERNKAFFAPVLQRAEKYGVNILVENFNKICLDNYFWIDNARDLLALIKYVDHPLFHAVWDTGHANLQEMPQHEELHLLGSEVKALHIQDNGGEWDQHLMPFTGTMNMDSVMQGLLNIGYNGYFTFEVGDPFTSPEKKRQYDGESRLQKTPLSLKIAYEKCLFELGKSVLSAYGVFEE